MSFSRYRRWEDNILGKAEETKKCVQVQGDSLWLCVPWRLREGGYPWDLDRNVVFFSIVAVECFSEKVKLSCRHIFNTQTQNSVSMWRKDYSKEWWRQGVRSWCMTVSVFVAHSGSLCALSLVSHFVPLAFSQLSQQTDVLLFWNWTVPWTVQYSRCF